MGPLKKIIPALFTVMLLATFFGWQVAVVQWLIIYAGAIAVATVLTEDDD